MYYIEDINTDYSIKSHDEEDNQNYLINFAQNFLEDKKQTNADFLEDFSFDFIEEASEVIDLINIDNYNVCKEVESIEISNKEENKSTLSDTQTKGNLLFTTKVKEIKNFYCGRKTDREKDNGKYGKHTKESKDNIVTKIKSFFGKSLYNYISNIIKKCDGSELLKLDVEVNKCLKRSYNLDLFNKTLKDLYIDTNISQKYKKKDIRTNEELIHRIYEEKKETEAIKILNLTYLEAFEIFRRKIKPNSQISPELEKKIEGTNILNTNYFLDAEKFIEKEKKKEKQKNEKNKDYFDNIEQLIVGFEEWFKNKETRDN